MGLCESMRGSEWRRCTGAFRATVGVLLLGFGLAQPIYSPAACPAPEAPQSLSQPQYHNTIQDDRAAFMAPLVQSFLHVVQPNPFPEDLILRVIDDVNYGMFNRETISNILAYEVGFLVCVVIGILYIVLMPIIGFFLACCRCCGNCGGKMYQKQSSSIDCRRRIYYWSAFAITVFIFAGNVCMFKSNNVLKKSLDQTPTELNNTVDNLKTFLAVVHEQVNDVVIEGYSTVDGVTRNLDAIGPQLGAEIQERFREISDSARSSIQQLDQETVNTNDQLNQLESSLPQLRSSLGLLQANVTAVRDSIKLTLKKPTCVGCDTLVPELDRLILDTDIPTASLEPIQVALDEVIKTNLSSKIMEVGDYFDTIPQTVTNDTKDVVARSKQLMRDIKRQIYKVTNDIPLSALNDMSATVDQVYAEIYKFSPDVQKIDSMRWSMCVSLSLLVLLVVVCYLLGLLLGPLGLKTKADPKKRSCTANCGGIFLMMGAGLSFVFSWLLMIWVVPLFLLGGNAYTLVCQPWSNGHLLKFIETSGLFPELQIGPALGLDVNVSISGFYSDCDENHSLWTALHLDEVINLQDRLNVSQYTEQIEQFFNDTDISLSIVTLLSPDVQTQLGNLGTTAKDFDPSAITHKMNNISSLNLDTTADKLDDLAAAQPNAEVRTELQGHATELRKIQSYKETTITPQVDNVDSKLRSLQSIAEKMSGTAGEVLSNVGAAQDFLDTNTTLIVKTESTKFVDCQLGYFTTYADWAYISLTQQVGRCGPVAGAVNSAETVACSYVVGSLNGFWYSLGWCLIFFIPGIILSIKLAKYYRKMSVSDANDDLIIMNHIPRAHMKFH